MTALSSPTRAVAYLLVGLTGSGKTTYAKRLEEGGVMRLSVDELVHRRHGRYGADYRESEYVDLERPVVEEIYRRLAVLLEGGRDVVLDHGLWQRDERNGVKKIVEAAGGRWRLVYFKVGRAELQRRLAARNMRDDANALTVTAEALADFYRRFEEPSGEGEEVLTQ